MVLFRSEPELDEQIFRARITDAVLGSYATKAERYGPELMQHLEKDIMLRTLDQAWREHLAAMDYLRQGIHLRSYAQIDYRYEYKREAYELFTAMLERVKYETVSVLTRVEVRSEAELQREEEERQRRLTEALRAQHAEAQSVLAGAAAEGSPDDGARNEPVRNERKVGRNEPCPCG